MQRLQRFTVLILAAAIFQGCGSTIRPYLTTIDYNPEAMEVIAPISGKATQGSVFCLLPTGRSISAVEILEKAKARTNADAIINTVVEQAVSWYFLHLYCSFGVEVSGLAVRFKPAFRPKQSTIILPTEKKEVPRRRTRSLSDDKTGNDKPKPQTQQKRGRRKGGY